MTFPPKKIWTSQSQKKQADQKIKYSLIEPSIFFEFWGLAVLHSYFQQTQSTMNLFQEQDLEIPKDLQDQFDFLKSKIEKLEGSLKTNEISYKKYTQSLLNSINRELSEIPCRSLDKLSDVKENIELSLTDLLSCCDDSTKSDFKRNDLLDLLEIPYEIFLNDNEMTLFWGFDILNSFSELCAFFANLYAKIDQNHDLPKQITDLSAFYHTARDRVRNEYFQGGHPDQIYIETLSTAIQREEKKKSALTSIQKHRIEVMRNEFDELTKE
mgnify:CR=1 FL=1